MSELLAEVCLAHRDPGCLACSAENDDLWVHPRDLPPAHESCRLCRKLIEHRRAEIDRMERLTNQLGLEIYEIENGDRHNDFHQQVMDGDE